MLMSSCQLSELNVCYALYCDSRTHISAVDSFVAVLSVNFEAHAVLVFAKAHTVF